jgi:hypothetical protein
MDFVTENASKWDNRKRVRKWTEQAMSQSIASSASFGSSEENCLGADRSLSAQTSTPSTCYTLFLSALPLKS